MNKPLLLTIVCALVSIESFCQTDKFWSANNESRNNIVTDKAVARQSFPTALKLFNLNIEPLRQELFKVVDNHSKHSTIISLPNADGAIEEFEIFEASNFEPDLQTRFPGIRAFSGKGVTDKVATLKLSISPQGIQTMIFRTDKENEFIEAYSQDHTVYAVFRSQRRPGQLSWTCTTEDHALIADINAQVANTNISSRSGGDLKTMRLVQSCNGEYANYFGATSAAQVGLVLAAYNATLTRCNGVYEKDLALHLSLIATTTDVIYYNPSTDPYSTTLSQWNAQLQSTLTSVIGEANYDIGHMFGASGGGGNAGCIGCVCVDGQKGSGITSPSDGIPQGDNFDIDYVVHEVGHQLGANHTFSHNLESYGVNKEVGSGITIMGYAGITSYDVARHSIDIYHEASIAQIQANLATKTCPVTTTITNSTPVISAVSNYIIPISTPFTLTGSATDADAGDVLTYCWEQNDNATTSGANSVASPGKATGPNWLSFSPITSPSRTCPKLSTILAGLFVTPVITGGDAAANIEALSSVSRTLNFRLTVRDNAAYSSTPPVTVGQTAFTDMIVTVSNTSGPFMVTQPNTNLTWPATTSQTVTWNVAGSTGAPVSCANVKILLSTDGGQTFPLVLAASTANDGSAVVTIPSVPPTSTARIRLEAVGNIFFDISNSNFNITGTDPDFDFANPSATTLTCGGATSATVTLGTVSYFGYSTPITLSASGAPAGTNISFGTNPVTPGNNSIVTLHNTNTLAPGTYNITVTGVSGSITKTRMITYIIQAGAAPTITSQPANQSVCAGQNAVFSVTTSGAAVTGYQWQLSTDGGSNFNNIAGATNSSLTVTGTSFSQNNFRYKVIISGVCNSVTSNAAILTVKAIPTVPVITPSATAICLGDVVTLNGTSTTSFSSTLGNGTSTSSAASTVSALGPNPLQNYYGGDKQQMLFRASELTALGLVNGTVITAIRLNLVTADPSVLLQNLVVKMKNTLTTTMASWETGLATVRTPGSYTPAVGWNNLILTTPFTWDGSNLVVEINYSNNNAGTAGVNTAKYSATSFVSTRFYRIDNATATAVDAYTGTNATTTFNYSQRNDVTFDYNNASNITWSPIADLYTDFAATSGYTGIPASTVYAKPSSAGTATFTATATNSGCSASSSQQISVADCSTSITLNLKLFLQGYYMGDNSMQSVLNNQAVPLSLATETDTIIVELHDPTTFAFIDLKKTVLQTNGMVSVSFTQPAGSYHIVIRHRNTIQTWSADPVACTSSTPLYDFSTTAGKAYGSNQVLVEPGVWALYVGDLNQDEFVDAFDYSEYNDDNLAGVNGIYIATDMNGDGFVDAFDYSQYNDNNLSGVQSVHP